MIVRRESTIIDYHVPFDQGLRYLAIIAAQELGDSSELRWFAFGLFLFQIHSTKFSKLIGK